MEGAQKKRPKTKRLKGQNVLIHKVPGKKTSQGTKRPRESKRHKDKTPQEKNHPKGHVLH